MADDRFFKNCGPFSLEKMAQIAEAEIVLPMPSGVGVSTLFSDISTLSLAKAKDVAVFHSSELFPNLQYREELPRTRAGLCIVSEDDRELVPKTSAVLLSESPYRAYALIASAFYPDSFKVDCAGRESIDPSAKIGQNCLIEPGVVIGHEAEIGDHVHIAANTVIGRGVVIGVGCAIGANVTITHSLLGQGVVVYPGARIGQSGFGFYMDNKGHIQVPQLGRVIIEDGVEIGSNTTIDRGSGPDTVIGAGSRLDNLIQIAHNVQLGRGCVIVAQVGIAGNTHVGDFAAIGGQAGIIGSLKIGQGARIAAQSGVMRDIADGEAVGGSPAVPAQQWHRQSVVLRRLVQGKRKVRDVS